MATKNAFLLYNIFLSHIVNKLKIYQNLIKLLPQHLLID